MTRQFHRTALLLAACLLAAACGGGSGAPAPPPADPPAPYEYSVPADIGDGWETGDLSSVGIDAALITRMMERVIRGLYEGIDSVAIARHGRLVHYWYDNTRDLDQFDAWIRNTDVERHVLHSTSKSFTSALAGIAVDLGFIASHEVPFYGLLDYESYNNWDALKEAMTLEDALTMRLGIDWDEWSLPYTNPRNDLVALENGTRDWAKALLDRPVTAEPGTVFAYNTAATIAIGQAVQDITGMRLAEFAESYLFGPLQIEDADWWMTPTGLPVGGSGLFLRTRDLLKFGQLYIDGGQWGGRQVISAEWIAASVARHVDVSAITSFSQAYGYQWWIGDFVIGDASYETWMTAGYGGQYMFCIPALDLVVAFTGHNYENAAGVGNLFDMMRLYVLPAVD